MIQKLLRDERIRKRASEQGLLYSAVDAVAVLADSALPAELWMDLKRRERALAQAVECAEFTPEVVEDALTVAGVLRLAMAIESPRGERVRKELVQTAEERLQEAGNPELTILRMRRDYQRDGRSASWITRRLQSIGTRHELVREWRRRGVQMTEAFRTLTNAFSRSAFGMTVNEYRRSKSLSRAAQKLRDHMSELELALTSLGESIAADLHRRRDSLTVCAMERDLRDAGEIIARTRANIEQQTGVPVVFPPKQPIKLQPAAQNGPDESVRKAG